VDKKYICYCGLYCENCAVKVKVGPASVVLYEAMKKAGFEDVIHMIPGGDGFWPFLKGMAENGMCVSCQDGGGDPGCAIRICTKEKGLDMCANCGSYPCDLFTKFLEMNPALKQDNALLREKGMDAWAELQDERKASGYTFGDGK
jgi:hypothetical protein